MILALDLSLTATGAERLVTLGEWLLQLVMWDWPDLAVLEGYSFGSRGRARSGS